MKKAVFQLKRVLLVLLGLLASSDAVGETTPQERPRVRPASALAGWADWERGQEIFRRVPVPEAPPLSPEQALSSFRLAPGFRIELFAAEPLIANPIFLEFDPDGRLWAIEYRGYMRDLAGTGEGDPICRLVILEDTDSDGRADRQTVFLDGLVMPRTFAFVQGGVLVAEPPTLWFCEDTDGDLRCDRKRKVGTYGVAGNPQHTANGLRYGLDNWLHNSDWPKRHRFAHDRLWEEDSVHRGQFGGSFDDFGRFYTCYESSALHADLFPAEYLLRNPTLEKALRRRGGRNGQGSGIAVNISPDAQEVFPIRPTPQITLGGLELRDDGRLRTYTVVSGSCIYNGHQFPDDAYGNAFIPEAGGHLIGRLRLSGAVELSAARFYPPEQEFIACTDERFRPVNARVGPDGALYIADMYHGIIEHVIFLVPWLTDQVKQRGLESGNDMGRIWRIVSDARPVDRQGPSLTRAPAVELVRLLAHPNGWHRLTAQRLLVERGDRAVAPALLQLLQSSGREGLGQPKGLASQPSAARTDPQALGRVHALWALDGLEALEWPAVAATIADPHEFVRATAARLAERFAGQEATAATAIRALGASAEDPSALVRLHSLLTLGSFSGSEATDLIVRSVTSNEVDLFRTAALTGLADRELEFLHSILRDVRWRERNSHRTVMLSRLAQVIFTRAESGQISNLLDMIDGEFERSPWRGEALLDGVLNAAPDNLAQVQPIQLKAEAAILRRLATAPSPGLVKKGYRLHQVITWPGDTQLRAAAVDLQPLSDTERRLVEQGQGIYVSLCAPCHQPHGAGLASVAPPLVGSEWVSGTPESLARILLHGLYGPVTVNGEQWRHYMPGFGNSLLTNDTHVAAVLTYVRRAWGNAASPVDPELVGQVRRATAAREAPWTAAELVPSSVSTASGSSRLASVMADEEGVFLLAARAATTYGQRLKYNPTLDILAPWVEENDVAEWHIDVLIPGTYEVRVTLGADEASAGDRFMIETRNGRISGLVPDTGGNARLQERAVGSLLLTKGLDRVILRPDGPLRRELADIRALRFIPARPAPASAP